MNWSDLNLLDTFSDPQLAHAAAAHFPVALAALGFPLVILAAVIPLRSDALRWLCVAVYLVLAGFAFLAGVTGETAADNLNMTVLGETIEKEIDRHREASEIIWIFALVTAVLCAVALVKSKGLRRTAMLLTLIASGATFLWVAGAAKTGDELIYDHGVGTPGLVPGARDALPSADEPDADAEDAGDGEATRAVPEEAPAEIPEVDEALEDEDYSGTPLTVPSGPPSVMPGQLEGGADPPSDEAGSEATETAPDESPVSETDAGAGAGDR